MKSIFSFRKISKSFLSLTAALFIFNLANAAVETVTVYQTSPTLSSSSVLRIQDGQYDFMVSNLSTWSNSFFNKKFTNRVIFRVDKKNLKVQPSDYTATVMFTITSRSWNGSSFQPSSVDKTLKISYKNGTLNYTDKAVYEYIGASWMSIEVKSLVITGASPSQCNLSLEAEIEAERYYKFDPQLIPTSLGHRSTDLASTGELEIYWDFIPGAEEYDLEWLYINNYDSDSTVIAPGNLNIDSRIFQFNSTRITTTNTYYRIPYIYGKGYILYRLRAIGKTDQDNYTNYKEGAWSSDSYTFSTVAAFAKKFPNSGEPFVSHDDNLNWQFSASYAENGKSKAVVSYFDGSLRNRQSVTKSKTDNEIIVGESIYDYQGRPAIQVLPVPVQSPKISFNPNFNQNTDKQPYSREDFDVDGSPCASSTEPMRAETTVNDPNKGASNYYSEYNPDKNGQQAYVPDAQQYPFTQVEYTPDNTGRIKAQGGVGKAFQLNDKKTSYFYSSPHQEELDRLFGSEAGDAVHYKKNLVRDANGQLSISYLDPQGHVVATCLAGEKPPALNSLNTLTTNWLRTDLLAKVKATDNNGSKNELVFSFQKLHGF
ncbi:MAG TPA: hypothetical protein VLB84_17845 [Bacteroidia bacterium]|nr:hypothetical protein [Bacteroidia bacterium]